jgi:UDP-GlcNAc:undecaprenyl-phosphate GlcNAc-1-phosphate transferase
VLAIPVFDSVAACARRWLTGRGVYQTDRGHFHHCLLRSGLSNRRIGRVELDVSMAWEHEGFHA